jgi:hypothetical protein
MCQLGNFRCLKLSRGIFVISHVWNYENALEYKNKWPIACNIKCIWIVVCLTNFFSLTRRLRWVLRVLGVLITQHRGHHNYRYRLGMTGLALVHRGRDLATLCKHRQSTNWHSPMSRGTSPRIDVSPWDRTPLNPQSNWNLPKKAKNQVKKI